jgi:hypothetical protein
VRLRRTYLELTIRRDGLSKALRADAHGQKMTGIVRVNARFVVLKHRIRAT